MAVGRSDSQKPEDLFIQRAIESTALELHLGQYPIFCITKERPNHTRMTYREKIRIGGTEITKEWSVQVTQHYGWPGEHEAEVWRALQHIAELRARAGCLTNPMETTLDEIREHMSSKSKGGRQWNNISRSLYCLGNTKLETNYWYDSKERNYDKANFSLIADLKLTQRQLQSGKMVINKVFVGFGPELFRNLQNRYVRPLDKGFMDAKLGRWLAKWLYELLGVKFYGLRKQAMPYRTRYSRLCALLGIKRQEYLSRAKCVLGPAHLELQREKFLAKVVWYAMSREKNDWVLHYVPGQRAKAEWERDYWRKVPDMVEPVLIEELPDVIPDPVHVDHVSGDELDIAAEVVTDEGPEFPVVEAQVVKERPKQLSLLMEPPPQATLSVADASNQPLDAPEVPAASPRKPRRSAAGQPEAPSQQKPASGERSSGSEAAMPGAAMEAYTRSAIQLFEQVTGKHRRLPRPTAAETRRLAEWAAAGVSLADIDEGTRTALARHAERAQDGATAKREIVSLAYVNGYVRDACDRRQRSEQAVRLQVLERQAFKLARLAQSEPLRQLEAEFHARFLKSSRDRHLAEKLLEVLVLVQSTAAGAVLLAASEETVEAVDTWWRSALSSALGTPFEVLGPAAWVARGRQ